MECLRKNTDDKNVCGPDQAVDADYPARLGLERMHDTEVTPAKCNDVSAMILAQALSGSDHSKTIAIPSQNSAFSPWTRAQV